MTYGVKPMSCKEFRSSGLVTQCRARSRWPITYKALRKASTEERLLLSSGVVNRVVTQTKADATYAEIRRLILGGKLAGGTVINQEQLAATLGVSTTPLREALRRLEAESLVEPASKGQVVVTEVNIAELPQIYVVREELDCLAARLAGSAATSEDHAALRTALDVAPTVTDTHLDAWSANGAFHRTIHAATHNPVLIDTLARIYLQYDRYNTAFTEYVLDETARREHVAMVSAIEQGRGDQADALMRAHYAHGWQTVLDRSRDARR
jgi:DNA-binding GntR family transcriptional regulator